MKKMLAYSIGVHGFFLIFLFFVTLSVGWRSPYLQTYHVNLIDLSEWKPTPAPAAPVQRVPRKTQAAQKNPKPVPPKPKSVELPPKKVVSKPIEKPTVVQKKEETVPQKPSEHEEKVQALKEKLSTITQEKPAVPLEAPTEEAALTPANVTPTLEADNFPFPLYLLNAEKKLRRAWAPPQIGSIEAIQEAVVVFRIGRNGKIMDVKIEKGSGNRYFDLAAMRAVYDANPLPPLPREYFEPSLLMHVSFLLNRNL